MVDTLIVDHAGSINLPMTSSYHPRVDSIDGTLGTPMCGYISKNKPWIVVPGMDQQRCPGSRWSV